MIFKRKVTRDPDIGSFCKIKMPVLIKMHESAAYKFNSVSYIKEIESSMITPRSLRKNLFSNNKVEYADSNLLYIGRASVFGNGLVEVIPMSIRRDGKNAVGVRTIIDANKSFIAPISSLTYTSPEEAETIMSHYNYTVANYIRLKMLNDECYNLENFSWASK
ncbi:MAG: hypothetical protein KUG81_07590 [Gammaproteobacteria bacterium]|nr:hypothetical protein [Gammaproteobacteria bacterium]